MEKKTREETHQEILDKVAEYCRTYHQKPAFEEGQRIPYASRVYDEQEMVNLVDSALEFWLTSGRYTDEFEQKLAQYLGIRYCSLVLLPCKFRLFGKSSCLYGTDLAAFGRAADSARGRDYYGCCRIPDYGNANDSVWGSSGVCGCNHSAV